MFLGYQKEVTEMAIVFMILGGIGVFLLTCDFLNCRERVQEGASSLGYLGLAAMGISLVGGVSMSLEIGGLIAVIMILSCLVAIKGRKLLKWIR